MKRFAVVPVVVLAALTSSGAVAATNLISNGDFLSGLLDWSATGDSANLVSSSTVFPSPAQPYSIVPETGLTYLLADPTEDTTLSQTFTDTPGDVVTLSFDIAYTGPGTVGASLFGSVGSNRGGIFNPAAFSWTTYTLVFIGTGSDELSFDIYSPPGSSGHGYFGLDNIIATETSPGGAPEPATWALMLAGFTGLGAALRARRRLAAV